MHRMAQRSPAPSISRRSLLFSAAAALLPVAAKAAEVLTPHDLALRYRAAVEHSLEVPRGEALIYGGLAETSLIGHHDPLNAPQYLLVVDSCPSVQVAFLYWRLLPGHYELVGASPASTGDPERTGCVATPCGVFGQADAAAGAGSLASRVYDFGMRRARMPGRGFAPLHLQAHAARGPGRTRLGRPQSDGRVLLPPSLVAFLDSHRVLDGARSAGRSAAASALVPFSGRYMVVVDSERDDRPEWTAAA
jgi:hypothetical protein